MAKTNVLSISGGSIRVALLGGMASGYLSKPEVKVDRVIGTSAGALVSALIAHYSSLGYNNEKISLLLSRFFHNEIIRPSQFANERSLLSIITSILRGKYEGVVDTTPLKEFMFKFFEHTNFSESSIKCEVVVYDLEVGYTKNVDNTHPSFLDYVYASTCIPLVMKPHRIDGIEYVDGGVSEFAPAPLGEPYSYNITMLVSEGTFISPVGSGFNPGNIIHMVKRIVNIFNSEIRANNVRRASKIIAPKKDYPVSLTKFTQLDIINMFNDGYRLGAA